MLYQETIMESFYLTFASRMWYKMAGSKTKTKVLWQM